MGSRVELFEQIRRDCDRETPVDPGADGAPWGSSAGGAAGVGVAVAAGQALAGIVRRRSSARIGR